jgi:L-ascorbate metabolism protein UlaG (beta-lactamase superfamily)
MQLISAKTKDEKFIAEVDAFQNDEDCFRIWWLGQSGYLLQWKGKRVLIDPYLSDSLTKKYAQTDKPHIRMSERVCDPHLLYGISILSSSHNHTDHLDAETLIPLLANNPNAAFIVPEANREFVAARVHCDPESLIGLNDRHQIRIDEFTFHGIPAKHNEIERDEEGHCRYLGYVIEFGKWKIYHSGDTLWFDGMEDLLRPFQLDLALLPINGNEASRKVAGNLDCREAAQLAKAVGASCVIPCHYDMFLFNTADVRDFEREAKALQQPYRVLSGGEYFQSS